MRLNGFKPVVFPTSSDMNVTFCLDSDSKEVMGTADMNPFKKDCITCDCANWTLSYDASTEVLHTQMSMGGSDGHTHSKHLWAELKKIGPPPTVEDSYMPGHGTNFSCNFTAGGRDSVPVDREWKAFLGKGSSAGKLTVVETDALALSPAASSGCPFSRHKLLSQQSSVHRDSTAATKSAHSLSSAPMPLDHCYTLNQRSGFQLAWTIDTAAQTLTCTVSAPALISADGSVNLDTIWVAIGFRPLSRSSEKRLAAEGTGHHMNFGMEGADIVTGSVSDHHHDTQIRFAPAYLQGGVPRVRETVRC